MKVLALIMILAVTGCAKKGEKPEKDTPKPSATPMEAESTGEIGAEKVQDAEESTGKLADPESPDVVPPDGEPMKNGVSTEKNEQEEVETKSDEQDKDASEQKLRRPSPAKGIDTLTGAGSKSGGGIGGGSGTGGGLSGPPPATMAAPAPLPVQRRPKATGYHDMDQDEPVQE